MKRAPLGYRGQQVLAYIRRQLEAGKRPPSYAMIADTCDMSIINVCKVVRRLERRGALSRCDTGARHRRGWHEPVIQFTTATTLAPQMG